MSGSQPGEKSGQDVDVIVRRTGQPLSCALLFSLEGERGTGSLRGSLEIWAFSAREGHWHMFIWPCHLMLTFMFMLMHACSVVSDSL